MPYMPVVSSIDGENRLIYLHSDTVNASVHPLEIYKDVRRLRKEQEELRKYTNFMKGDGNISKGGGKYTERYFTLLEGARIVPYDISHVLSITGTIITDDGKEGVYCFNRAPLTAGVQVDIQYIPPQVEVIVAESSYGGGTTAQAIWEYQDRTLSNNVTIDNDMIHDALNTYDSKDEWKADTTGLATSNDIMQVTIEDSTIHQALNTYDSKDEWKADITGLATGDQVTQAVTDINQSITDAQLGNWELIGNQLIIKGTNDQEIARFNLFDAAGNPTMRAVYKRERV